MEINSHRTRLLIRAATPSATSWPDAKLGQYNTPRSQLLSCGQVGDLKKSVKYGPRLGGQVPSQGFSGQRQPRGTDQAGSEGTGKLGVTHAGACREVSRLYPRSLLFLAGYAFLRESQVSRTRPVEGAARVELVLQKVKLPTHPLAEFLVEETSFAHALPV